MSIKQEKGDSNGGGQEAELQQCTVEMMESVSLKMAVFCCAKLNSSSVTQNPVWISEKQLERGCVSM